MTTAIEARRQAILHGSIAPTLARLTAPVILVILAQTFVAMLEAWWVSRLGTAAVAGVALVLPVFVLMGTMSNDGIGGGATAAVALGAPLATLFLMAMAGLMLFGLVNAAAVWRLRARGQ
ncbi:hypothetical protein [Sandarakinorhabdus rubra]|uniref:hypothetical protein n=1 Tax=Sandarakinorhabdus rubra TaxID=2672568 RepID=UPI0013DA25E7|nr:hypothetical protein [Sandarakinorhabdus rubra]